LNGVHIAATGRLGSDPEQRYSSTGKLMLTFSIAVDENTAATEDRAAPETLWLRCTAWEAMATELAPRLRKGAQVYVEGKLRHGRWETAAGEARCGLNVSCWRVDVHGQLGRQVPRREPELRQQEVSA
jgi:single-strand DNA-binding protein